MGKIMRKKEIFNLMSRPLYRNYQWSAPGSFMAIMAFSFSFILFDLIFGCLPTKSGCLNPLNDPDLYNEIFNVCLWLGLFFGFLGLVGLICNHSRVKK